jgi:signal transduction histidine kinase
MTFMVLATLFIVGFITVVLLMVNWSLMKQKLLLQTNVDFFNNMAHEFRTPLSSIGLAVNRLTKKHEDLRENPFLAVIKRENTQLLQEVERVLHLAKIENGEYILEKEKLSIESLIRASIDSLSMSISEKMLKFF